MGAEISRRNLKCVWREGERFLKERTQTSPGCSGQGLWCCQAEWEIKVQVGSGP